MKKLMFVAAAAAAMVAVADVTSANIVGYSHTVSDSKPCPIVGAQFFKVSGGTFSLKDLTVPGSREWIDNEYWECDIMAPGVEYIRVFKKDVLLEDASYVYVSENFLIQNFQEEEAKPDVSDYAWAIGWWKNADIDYADAISRHDDTEMVKEDVEFDDCQCFIGKFADDHEIKIQTSGAVSIETFGYDSQQEPCPIFGNQLPVDIDLNDIAVPGSREWKDDEYWECDIMAPGVEYIRIFKKDVLVEDASYVYISENFLIQNFQEEEADPDVSDYAWAIGWWKNADIDYADAISRHDDTEMVKEKVTIKAGTGFIGKFASDHNLIFNFPSALELPTQAK